MENINENNKNSTTSLSAEKDTAKKKVLDMAVSQIERSFGKGAIMRLGASVKDRDVPVIPTGSISLDLALGIGGLPRGRIIEIYGPESSGKTTLALHVLAETQKQGGVCAFIDAEHALDPAYAKKLGVNIDELFISQPDSGEQALEIADILVRSGSIDTLVIDSVAALVPKAELEGEMGDVHVGLQARLMSQALRKLTGSISKSKTILIFINQIRQKIGISYGNPETTTGGNALKFYASVRIDIRKVSAIKEKEEVVGSLVNIKIAKNKLAPPLKTVQLSVIYGRGFCRITEIIDLAVKGEIIEKAGSWYSYKNNKIGQGKDSVRQYLESQPEIAKEIVTTIMQNHHKINLISEEKE